jgi:hypothetical protein
MKKTLSQKSVAKLFSTMSYIHNQIKSKNLEGLCTSRFERLLFKSVAVDFPGFLPELGEAFGCPCTLEDFDGRFGDGETLRF